MPDPVQRVLLALILACLVLLAAESWLRPGTAARYTVSVLPGLPGRSPVLLRVDTHSGRVEHLQVGNKERPGWMPLGEATEAGPQPAEKPSSSAEADPVPEASDAAGTPAGAEGALEPEAGPEGAPEVLALASALSEASPSGVRVWAAEMMGHVAGPAREDAVSYLTAALDDPDPAVRLAASEALAQIARTE